jgi:DHA1 family bicyclomycin/chloramphenicol resistance-like MFS transporter
MTITARLPSLPVLVGLSALMPLGMHVVLPAIPDMATGFNTSLASMQMTITLYMVTVALGQIVYGPLSDRFGRRPPLLVGLTIFLAGSIISAVAPTGWVLLLGRAIQGAGACVGMVLGRAMVRDVYPSERSVNILAYVTMALMVVPGLVPIFSSLLVETMGWRLPLLLTGIMAIVMFWVSWRLTETNRNRIPLPSPLAVLKDFGRLLRLPRFLVPAMGVALPNGGFWAFVAVAPALLTDRFDVPVGRYGFYFVLLPTCWCLGSFGATRLMPRVGEARLVLFGVAAVAVLALTMLALLLVLPLSALALFGLVALMHLVQALAVPALQVRALGADPLLIGSASGLMGFLQMSAGALATLVVGQLYDGTAVPSAGALLFTSTTALLLLLWLRRRG